ncbi:MAG TPA: glycosyltransferase family 2 protein [Lutibacter sp.]
MKKIAIKILRLLGIERKVIRTLKKINWYFIYLTNNLFNPLIIKQNRDYKTIPIIIISFNQLFYLRQLITFLQKHQYKNIIIIDNNSTYQPLLDYFDTIESFVAIHKLKENLGHLVFWKQKELYNKYSKGYYVITDPDIVPVANCPGDFVLHFKRILDKNLQVTKVGFSLKIDDIPDSNPNKQKVIDWESQFWRNQNKDGNYHAPIDTTFALYRPKSDFENLSNFLRAVRTKEPYTAKHGGWYFDIKNLTAEQNSYHKLANESSSWKIDDNGNLYSNDYD